MKQEDKRKQRLFDRVIDFVAGGILEDLILQLAVHEQLRVPQQSPRRRDVHKLARLHLQVSANVVEDLLQDHACCLWRAAKSVDDVLGSTVVFLCYVMLADLLFLY